MAVRLLTAARPLKATRLLRTATRLVVAAHAARRLSAAVAEELELLARRREQRQRLHQRDGLRVRLRRLALAVARRARLLEPELLANAQVARAERLQL